MTTLLDEIKALIALNGPITVERYMELALAHPEFGYYMNRDPFGATRRFHHLAGNLADVRRADRALGGRGLVEHGVAESRPSHRTRARPRHADERCAARRAHRAGIPRRARRLAHRDEPDPGRDAARTPSRRRRGDRLGADPEGGSRRAGDRDRQRVSRRPAGPPVRARQRSMAGARGAAQRRGRACLRRRRRARALHPGDRAGRRGAGGEPCRPSLHVRTRRPARRGRAARRC